MSKVFIVLKTPFTGDKNLINGARRESLGLNVRKY